ncbi:asparagine synthase (glutamine-hydrolysing) [Humibacillus xanthopallidus]|uniref:asparagine synthase (glutamine-hydrolyzing) n=1 Tax=Humibacillus xanthopallidus TaxID=412689 RepID=A0A543PV79_9MICO|nr:asparagine synthase (glutamine-hydrolyzing) [Humibacillus xanthopallidus]TQN47984.1 asparagine synthase (glutamine-hydrolysing) [Humibacillus xanthopallidus]
MCGIAGYVGLEADPDLLRRMNLAQRHRGPDAHGTFVDRTVGLAHQRLSVIDAEGGRQPMTTADGRFTLVYNGEVYNYPDLREELVALGRTFVTDSDTEVVLQAYAEWGPDAFDRFNGMFGLAVWDRDGQTLVLARDHFGIKPLYLARVPGAAPDDDVWLFASEIRPLLATGLIEARPDEQTLYRYLRFRIHDDGRETFFDGIERLLPGEMMTIGPAGVERRAFTSLREDLLAAVLTRPHYDESVVTDFRDVLTRAVRMRLRSDVPVGTSLSGGLDSSAVVALIDELLPEAAAQSVGPRQNTFSAVFSGYRNDEERWVDDALAGRESRVDGHKVRPGSADLVADLTDFVRTQEEPVISSGPYAQYCVMREASRHVTVMLDGQGADELLAGYVPQLVVHLRRLVEQDRRAGLREAAAQRDVLAGLAKGRVRGRLLAALPTRGRGGVTSLLRPAFVAAHREQQYAVPTSTLRERLVHDLFEGSLPALLRYEDKNAMRFSLEGRVPFLDLDLVRFVFAQPDDAVIGGGWNKRMLRDAVSELLPTSITRRRNKIGFTTPQNEWFHELREQIYAVFLSESFARRPYFDRTEVLGAFEAWLSGTGGHDSMVFWRILNVELWLREFIDAPAEATADAVPAGRPTTADPAEPRTQRYQPNPGKQLDLVLPGGGSVRRYPVTTSRFTEDDDLHATVLRHLEPFVAGLPRAGSEHGSVVGTPWYLFVSEKIVATTQHRSHYLWDIDVKPSARLLSRYVTRTPAGIGLGSPFTMQLAIDEAGLPRILFASAAAAAGRLVGRRGLFYDLVGSDVRAIDGPTEYSVPPANMSAKLAPADPVAAATALSRAVRDALPEPFRSSFRGTVVIDANDLGCNVLGTDAPGPWARYEQMFADNPLGQGTEQTPLAVVAVVDGLDGLDPSTEGGRPSAADLERAARHGVAKRARRTPSGGVRTRTPDPTAYLRR